MNEIYNGFSQISFIKKLSEKRDVKTIIENFKAISSYILNRKLMKYKISLKDVPSIHQKKTLKILKEKLNISSIQ